ncbi:MAG: hypothetical protein JWM68_2604 [Verrucomicrobiales bacterium]|nr:hypothetical protein [Verrucomicrobiales bacterium]
MKGGFWGKSLPKQIERGVTDIISRHIYKNRDRKAFVSQGELIIAVEGQIGHEERYGRDPPYKPSRKENARAKRDRIDRAEIGRHQIRHAAQGQHEQQQNRQEKFSFHDETLRQQISVSR